MMTRAERRRGDHEIRKLSQRHPLCSRAFIHGDIGMMGHTADGAMQAVGECCSRKLSLILAGGCSSCPM